jgi:hypothetical protein
MKLDKEQLDNITAMAGLFFTPKEIATNLQVDEIGFKEQLKLSGSDINKAYESGRILGDIKLRTGIMNAAEHGSGPAQQMMQKIKEDSDVQSKIDE